MKLFVNDLTVMDFSYLCPQRGMVGESWIVDIILDGGLNEESMVQDFGIVKKELKRVIDDYVDHKLVVPAEYHGTKVVHQEEQERVSVDFEFANDQHIHLYCPPEAYAFVYSEQVDKQSVNAYLKEVIAIHLPENVQSVEITLRDEEIPTPFYHYTHGLKKHEGNCQRIAHGHRSKVLIYENGEESLALQQAWAERWADIYIGTREDLVSVKALSHSLGLSDDDYFAFKYESSQGVFEMAIPKSVCEIIETDSTVECLAQYIYDEIKTENSNLIEVRAFEGVGKGAIVRDE
ncbi:6-carboxytetrahydropterin synthase [Glaciecola sp. KUL10]|uniref:6-carboxytetrahydropterin synthase n=1 Tax=Glaciecola sp. (strain KUL10) TaxID=2161813 RepID=UPI000D788AB8|nr:6-carboxytetrahydropterin synthase [Glaciecola sp. KUL10]GBL02747.1 hypothetical protein KUL10_00200 [Glaciecola sp. KUL10]